MLGLLMLLDFSALDHDVDLKRLSSLRTALTYVISKYRMHSLRQALIRTFPSV